MQTTGFACDQKRSFWTPESSAARNLSSQRRSRWHAAMPPLLNANHGLRPWPEASFWTPESSAPQRIWSAQALLVLSGFAAGIVPSLPAPGAAYVIARAAVLGGPTRPAPRTPLRWIYPERGPGTPGAGGAGSRDSGASKPEKQVQAEACTRTNLSRSRISPIAES